MQPMQGPPSYGQPQHAMQQPPTRVVVTDVDMKFGTMIVFMIKWAIAAIPAAFILSLIVMALGVVFVVVLSALGLAAGAAASH